MYRFLEISKMPSDEKYWIWTPSIDKMMVSPFSYFFFFLLLYFLLYRIYFIKFVICFFHVSSRCQLECRVPVTRKYLRNAKGYSYGYLLNATVNNIPAISFRSALLGEKTVRTVPKSNYQIEEKVLHCQNKS